MRIGITILSLLIALSTAIAKETPLRVPSSGEASWYGEAHRGKLMANGKKFDPNRLTAACWFNPSGSKVKFVHRVPGKPVRSVLVSIIDRGPARELVRDGRIIDLSHAAFKRLGNPDVGLIPVVVKRVQ